MVGISPSIWRIRSAHLVPGIAGLTSFGFWMIHFSPLVDPGSRYYWISWTPEIEQLEGRSRRDDQHSGHILPRKMTMSMAHACGIIPDGRIYTKKERPDLYSPEFHLT